MARRSEHRTMLMTPGPTAVPDQVREAMATEQPNPDVDPAFADRYEAVTDKLSRVYGTDDDVIVMGGEGILGLEAAIASTIEPGDDVLVVANGLYGEGFANFVESYGGNPKVVAAPRGQPLDVEGVTEALGTSDFKAATMVHCDTPTGNHNDIEPILDRLADREILSIVDAVSSLGGTPVPTGKIDIALGASQKAISAPTGLTTAAVSDRAWDVIEERDPSSLYTSFLPWKDVSEGFPYTHLAANVAALDGALDLLLDEGLTAVYDRHERAAQRCRQRGGEMGLDLYPAEELSSPTVTAFHVPGRATEIQRTVADRHDITLATGLGDMADDILRVGHMGYNANVGKVERTMDAIEDVLD
ncbi:aminotransferase class V [Halanaeroarchaeum sulfurireducens]|uniref:Aminotransferase class V n=2 Tax=Halanaeroarchaeum sulfurireducens TaxID=1604004 RepID=A0A0F7P9Y1_9EURY|nr:aminotransferase class V [Halanaeroarchaeum sulfurireducens]